MLKIKKINLTNFLSHPKTEISFNPDTHVLIDGHSGSGKSSIIDAITFALYGKGRSDNRSMVKKGAKKASVILELQDEEKKYKIERSTTDKGKHELKISENNKPVEALGLKGHQEYLEKKILHSSYTLFINSILHLQNGQNLFVNMPATDRKNILLEIVNASLYDEYYEKTKNEIKKVETENEHTEFIVSEKEKSILENKELSKDIKTRQSELSNIDKEISDVEKRIEENVEKQKQYEKIKNDLENKNQQRELLVGIDSELCGKIKVIGDKIEGLKSVDIQALKNEVDSLANKKTQLTELNRVAEEANHWNERMMEIMNRAPVDIGNQAGVEEANKQITSLMQEQVDICPELNKKCPILVNKRDEQIKRLEDTKNTKKQALDSYIKAKLINDMERDALGDKPFTDNLIINNLKNEISALEMKEKEYYQMKNKEELINTYEKELAELSHQKAENDKKIAAIQEEIKNQDALDNNVVLNESNSLKNIKVELDQKKQNIVLLIKEAERAIGNIKKLETELKDLKKKNKESSEKIEGLKLLKEAFGSSGIKSIIIDYIVPELEGRINAILSKLSDFTVKLDTQKDAVSSDSVIDGLFITIFNELGESFDYVNFSGGEKIKVSIAISEALAEISNINFRVLDEAIVALDEESTQQFLDAMSVIQQKVDQIICISHINAIKDIFNEKILVTKTNGSSIVSSP